MRSDWILDVLSDLKAFAAATDLPVLAEQLDDTAIVAMAEIASLEERMLRRPSGKDTTVGIHPGGIGTN